MLIVCDICFEVTRDNRTTTVQIAKHLDTEDDLEPQAKAEAQEWVARQVRIHHRIYTLRRVTVAHFNLNKQWYSQLDWPNTVAALHG